MVQFTTVTPHVCHMSLCLHCITMILDYTHRLILTYYPVILCLNTLFKVSTSSIVDYITCLRLHLSLHQLGPQLSPYLNRLHNLSTGQHRLLSPLDYTPSSPLLSNHMKSLQGKLYFLSTPNTPSS